MLTRLKVRGFKNLIESEVRFGPLTCIAGTNGTGKSNLFDSIAFLSDLAEKPLLEAARSVRAREPRNGDLHGLFNRAGGGAEQEMSFEAEMIIPSTGVDDLGQAVKATSTFLRYELVLALDKNVDPASSSLRVRREVLRKITHDEIKQAIKFECTNAWKQSVISQGHRTAAFISTIGEDDNTKIQVHQDGAGGKPLPVAAARLQRTVVSASSSAESPTIALARREMQSWKLLQLEPSALRASSEFMSQTSMSSDGSHLPATLYRLLHEKGEQFGSDVRAQLTFRLTELLDDARSVDVQRDEARQILTLLVQDKHGTWFPARSLSDGTLRFIALAVLELDPQAKGVICLEEPENGIHPARVAPMLRLLTEIAVDPNISVNDDNPLRQVIISTHSPAIVQQVQDQDLLIAQKEEVTSSVGKREGVTFRPLNGTWRAVDGVRTLAKGQLLAYLNPAEPQEGFGNGLEPTRPESRAKRIIDRPDIRQLFFDGFANVS